MIDKNEYLRRLELLADLLESGYHYDSNKVFAYVAQVRMAGAISGYRPAR